MIPVHCLGIGGATSSASEAAGSCATLSELQLLSWHGIPGPKWPCYTSCRRRNDRCRVVRNPGGYWFLIMGGWKVYRKPIETGWKVYRIETMVETGATAGLLGSLLGTSKDRGLIGLVPRPLTAQFRTPAALPLHAPPDDADERNG